MNKPNATQKEQNVDIGWSKVLDDAEAALKAAQSHARKLKKATAQLRRMVASGEPLPDYLKGALGRD
jgi:hypothetical protein